MSTLRETVYNTVINLHRNTRQEWIHLKDIYQAVGQIKEVKNGGASIRAILETHSVLSRSFLGPEEYILKEKGSGLYKSIYYENLKRIESISVGDTFTREQLMNIFKISGQSGIMKTNALNCLVLVTNDQNDVYNDGTIENGILTYTGEGLIGDQQLNKNNKSIYQSKENNLPMYLFNKDKDRNYIFEGQVELCDVPYQVEEKDFNGDYRLVWKFPLKIIFKDNYDYTNDERFLQLIYEINEIEDQIETETSNNYELPIIEGILAIRKYQKSEVKLNRSKRPDYIANEIIKNTQGIINEKKIYELELKKMVEAEAFDKVKEMEEFFTNKKENEGFDILSYELDENGGYVEKYIEVKSTKGNEGTPIDITANEIEFAKEHIDNYYLYRIINSDSKQRYLKIVKGRDLFEKYSFIPTEFKIYSN